MSVKMLVIAGAATLGLGLGSAAFAQGMQTQPGMGGQMQPGMGGGQMQPGMGGQMQQGGMADDGMRAQRPMRSKKMMKRTSKKSMKRNRSM